MPTRTLSVREVTFATPRTRLISLDLGETAFPFTAGQAVMVGLHGSPLRKPYSIASAPSEAAQSGAITLLLQVDNSGALDPHLELAAAGARLDVEGPFGTFGLPAHLRSGPILFVAGGTGIAPLRSMLIERLTDTRPSPVTVVYSARSPEELAYRAELEALARAGRIRVHLTVTRETGAGWTGRSGRIDKPLLQTALVSRSAWCVLCGPPQLVENTTSLLRELGVRRERVLTERYDQ